MIFHAVFDESNMQYSQVVVWFKHTSWLDHWWLCCILVKINCFL